MATMSGMQMQEQRMTSLDIAAVTGKTHAHVLRDIRNMEPAWERECGAKFGRTSGSIWCGRPLAWSLLEQLFN